MAAGKYGLGTGFNLIRCVMKSIIKHVARSTASGMLLLSSGCLVIPHRTVVTGAVSGCVINEHTGKPIADAQVRYYREWASEHFTIAYSNEEGFFKTKPIRQWHWFLFIGSPGRYPYPKMLSVQNATHCFDLIANGFESKLTRVSARTEVQPMEDLTNVPVWVSKDVSGATLQVFRMDAILRTPLVLCLTPTEDDEARNVASQGRNQGWNQGQTRE